jgi:hypothetical protein
MIMRIASGAAASLFLVAAWPFRRGAPDPPAPRPGSESEVDRRDWIYGEGSGRKPSPTPPSADPDDSSVQSVATPTDVRAAEEQARTVLAEAETARERLLEESRHDAELEARAIVERAENEARQILAAARDTAADADATTEGPQVETAARRAEEIIAAAEERAREILAGAHAVEARMEDEAARAGTLVLRERARLSAFLRELLSEVEAARAPGLNEPDVADLDQVRERRQSSTGNEFGL